MIIIFTLLFNTPSINKMSDSYKLAISTLFDTEKYGKDENSSPGIENHYLILYTIEPSEFYSNEYKDIINLISTVPLSTSHPTVRNYNAIVHHENYIKLDIVKCDELSGLEQVCYIKTFWIKIIQRRWKKVYKERQVTLKGRSSLLALKERSSTGKWPLHLRDWPEFRLNLLL